MVRVKVNGQPLDMEVDTGATVSIVPEAVQQEMFPQAELRKPQVQLKTYTGEPLKLKGEMSVLVEYQEQQYNLTLTVVEGEGPNLFGRDWLNCIRLDWQQICTLEVSDVPPDVSRLCSQYGDVFKDGRGTIHPFEATLKVDEKAQPKFCKHRPVPYSIREAVEEELDRLEAEGILIKTDHSEWATPIVVVPKTDGKYRICGDFKITLNPVLNVDQYPLPKPQDLFATLAGGKEFTKLDLSQAYLQLPLDQASRKYVVINTHKGLYQYTRLPFGVSSAPAMFQKVMETILAGIPGVICYLDDILVTGTSREEHLKNLEQVLKALQGHGLRLKLAKCKFMQGTVEYLGHILDSKGVHTCPSKIEAITKAPKPRNVKELRSFLGLINYYRKFSPNLAMVIEPLTALLKDGHRWFWTAKCAEAFESAKRLLTTSPVLVHYDPSLPLRMAADASAYGIGAVISHVLPSGEEKPVAFCSRTLSPAEANYSQIEKEALALVFGIQRFQQYLYGRQFTMVTDHKPLMAILGPKHGIPALAAARLQRWAVQLSAYSYDIEFRETSKHANADALSRLPLEGTQPEQFTDAKVLLCRQVESLPVQASHVQQATRSDKVLQKVIQFTRNGWPTVVPETCKPFLSKRHELTVEAHCLMWGCRVVIPSSLQEVVLQELHREHLGVAKMKALARSHLWWPGLDKDLETLARSCQRCQEVKQAPPKAPLHPWLWPSRPWQRIHVDYAGPFLGENFFLVIDAHSKWGEVYRMSSTTSDKTIECLRNIFATYGLPRQLVSDNGPQFCSEEFSTFLKANGVKHTRTTPYHPASNGEAERFVRTFKQNMKAVQYEGLPMSQRLANFLLSYRSTPHATTGVAPCELFLGRMVRTRLDLLTPNLEEQVAARQAQQKEKHDQHARQRDFVEGQRVMVRGRRPGSSGTPGVVVEKIGPVTYMVDIGEGQTWKCHVDQIRDFPESPFTEDPDWMEVGGAVSPEVNLPDGADQPGNLDTPAAPEATLVEQQGDTHSAGSTAEEEPATVVPEPGQSATQEDSTTNTSTRRGRRAKRPVTVGPRLYPMRSRRAPDYYGT